MSTHRSRFLPLVIVLMVTWMIELQAAEPANEFHLWATDFYNENTACSVATIASVQRTLNSVDVTLSVEESTGDALANTPKVDRNNWMALHCPSPLHHAWDQNPPEFDVKISASLGKLGIYSFSCAGCYQENKLRTSSKKDTVLEKLKKLFIQRQIEADE